MTRSSCTVALLLAALCAAPSTAVALVRTPVTSVLTFTAQESPGTVWFTPPDTLHVRNEVDTGFATGDLTGAVTAVVNRDLGLDSGIGCGQRGTFTMTTDSVVWTGTFTDCGQSDHGINLVVAHATDGSKLLGRLIGQSDGTILIVGTVTTP